MASQSIAFKELLVGFLVANAVLAQMLIAKAIINEPEFQRTIAEERAKYQPMFKSTRQ